MYAKKETHIETDVMLGFGPVHMQEADTGQQVSTTDDDAVYPKNNATTSPSFT